MHIFPNGKKYIGITRRKPEIRWNHGRGYGHSAYINNAIRKYGWDNIKHEILMTGLTKEQAEAWEIALIALHKCNNKNHGYNIEKGGNLKGDLSEEAKMKLAMHGRKVNQYDLNGHFIKTWNRIIDVQICGIANKEKVYKTCKGERKSAGGFMWRYYNGNTNNIEPYKKKRLTGEDNPMYGKYGIKNPGSKPINQYDLDGNFIKTWSNAREASRETGISFKEISAVCNGQCKSAMGFQWRFYNGNTDNIGKLEWNFKKGKEHCLYGKTGEFALHSKPVIQYTKDMVFVGRYVSLKDAEEKTGIKFKNISQVLRGSSKTAGGYIWKYASQPV